MFYYDSRTLCILLFNLVSDNIYCNIYWLPTIMTNDWAKTMMMMMPLWWWWWCHVIACRHVHVSEWLQDSSFNGDSSGCRWIPEECGPTWTRTSCRCTGWLTFIGLLLLFAHCSAKDQKKRSAGLSLHGRFLAFYQELEDRPRVKWLH